MMSPFDEIMKAVLVTLTPREEFILRMYYGFGCPRRTAREIGEYQKVTAKRIWQIIKKAKREMAWQLAYRPDHV